MPAGATAPALPAAPEAGASVAARDASSITVSLTIGWPPAGSTRSITILRREMP